MPLHHQYSGQSQAPDGQAIVLPPSLSLRVHGPAVNVAVAISPQLESTLAATNQAVPAPITGLALVDTGAGATCIDEKIAIQLGIAPIDVVNISSASHASTRKPVYPVRLSLLGTNLVVNASRAIGVPLRSQSFIALLGRDFLERFVVIYNGPAGEMTIGF